MKARELVASAMRKLGVLGQGAAPTASELQDGLSAFNAMVDSWSAEGLAVPSQTREEFTLTPGQGSYSMGSGGDFNTSRPVSIEFAGLLIENGQAVESPVGILNDREWAEKSVKTLQSELPRWIHIARGAPNWTVQVWPVPSAAHKLVLYSEKPLSRVTADTEITALEGYERALIYNLAIELASEFEREPSASVVAVANAAKGTIMARNSRESILTCDSAVLNGGRVYDIKAGK